MVQITTETSTGPEYVKKFAKQMLKNSIFIGTYQEKRFVECLKEYRDVVTISNDETEFIENVIAVKKRLESEFDESVWIGITSPHGIGTPAGYNLWVELPIGIFGKYWFKVKTVDFLSDQIILKLTVLRAVSNESNCNSDIDLSLSLSDIQFWAKERIQYFYKDILTIKNVKNSIIFISLLLSTLVLSLISATKYILEYLLRLIDELSKLIRTLTPVIIHTINAFGRIVFGLFHLIAALFKKTPPPQPVYTAYVNYDPNYMPKTFSSIPYNRPRAAIRDVQ